VGTLVQFSTEQRRPPPCAMQNSVAPTAPFVQFSFWQRLPPPWLTQYALSERKPSASTVGQHALAALGCMSPYNDITNEGWS
jgi:hypothetical protein